MKHMGLGLFRLPRLEGAPRLWEDLSQGLSSKFWEAAPCGPSLFKNPQSQKPLELSLWSFSFCPGGNTNGQGWFYSRKQNMGHHLLCPLTAPERLVLCDCPQHPTPKLALFTRMTTGIKRKGHQCQRAQRRGTGPSGMWGCSPGSSTPFARELRPLHRAGQPCLGHARC